ncbi:MAG TPA: VacB/RNase II family 3'-5' exoribonuclease, partial [Planctomycetota bacterium]|nr:VacB/RNase II family 3'-5' exoribonuclease [Planctomycetota bacterium]
ELPREYPALALAEAKAIRSLASGAAWPDRVDLRKDLIFTIDPVDAKDFDDAVSLEELPGGEVRLGVHIADVSHFVQPGSLLDAEAEKRGTSVYLPGQVVPMLPERLSNDLASLRPDEDRLTKTVRITFARGGKVKRFEVFRSVIRSRRRFTYEEALAILENIETGKELRDLPEDHAAFTAVFRSMARLRDDLHKVRRERGALYLDIPKLRLVLEPDGSVAALGRDARDPSHALIEELMLAANEAVASYFDEHNLPLVARVHPPPEERKLEELKNFVKALGFRFDTRGGQEEFQKLIDEVSGDPLSSVIQLGLLRTMGHAEYVLGNGLHFALATTSYCHFTSPIRRYPDLLVHQVLDEHFDQKLRRAARREELEARLPHAAEKASELERRAEEAEREMTSLLLIRHLAPMVGQEMDARIVSVHPFGFFVRVEETLVEGLIHVSGLGDDFYEFNREKLALRGKKKGKQFQVGERVRVELHEVDADMRVIGFRFVKKLGAGK